MTQAPQGFSIDSFYRGIYLFQKWAVFPGHVTDGPKDVVRTLDQLGVPADLTGKRVLDIAPWNGFFTFECARRGAAEVVALGPEDPAHTGFDKTRKLLGLTSVSYERGSVYGLSPERFGRFDIILFLGLFNHLRHPLLALDRIYDVCDGMLCVDTPVIDGMVYDRTVSAETRDAVLAASDATNQLSMLYFTGAAETGDEYNWFMPNSTALAAMVQSSGFRLLRDGHEPSWGWVTVIKAERQFVVGLEGYNPGVARL